MNSQNKDYISKLEDENRKLKEEVQKSSFLNNQKSLEFNEIVTFRKSIYSENSIEDIDLKEKFADLKKQLKEEKQKNKELSLIRDEFEILNQKLFEKQNELNKLKEKYTDFEKHENELLLEVNKQAMQKSKFQEKYNDQQKQILILSDEFKKENSRIQNENKELQQQIKNLEEQLFTNDEFLCSSKLDNDLSQLKQENFILKIQTKQAEQQTLLLEKKLHLMNEKLNQLNNQLEIKNKQIDTKNRLDEVQNNSELNQINKLNEQNEQLQKKINLLQIQIKQQEFVLVNFVNSKPSEKQTITQIQSKDREILELTQKIQNLQQEKNQLSERTERLKNKSIVLNRENQKLESINISLNTELNSLRSKLVENQLEIETLKQMNNNGLVQLQHKEEDLNQLKQYIEVHQNRNKNIDPEYTENFQNLTNSTNKFLEMSNLIIESEKTREIYENDLKKLNEKYNDSQKQIVKLKQKLKEKNLNQFDQTKKLNSKVEQEKYQFQIDQLQNQLKIEVQANQILKQKLNLFREEQETMNEEYSQEIRQFNKEISIKDIEIYNMTFQMKQFQEFSRENNEKYYQIKEEKSSLDEKIKHLENEQIQLKEEINLKNQELENLIIQKQQIEDQNCKLTNELKQLYIELEGMKEQLKQTSQIQQSQSAQSISWNENKIKELYQVKIQLSKVQAELKEFEQKKSITQLKNKGEFNEQNSLKSRNLELEIEIQKKCEQQELLENEMIKQKLQFEEQINRFESLQEQQIKLINQLNQDLQKSEQKCINFSNFLFIESNKSKELESKLIFITSQNEQLNEEIKKFKLSFEKDFDLKQNLLNQRINELELLKYEQQCLVDEKNQQLLQLEEQIQKIKHLNSDQKENFLELIEENNQLKSIIEKNLLQIQELQKQLCQKDMEIQNQIDITQYKNNQLVSLLMDMKFCTNSLEIIQSNQKRDSSKDLFSGNQDINQLSQKLENIVSEIINEQETEIQSQLPMQHIFEIRHQNELNLNEEKIASIKYEQKEFDKILEQLKQEKLALIEDYRNSISIKENQIQNLQKSNNELVQENEILLSELTLYKKQNDDLKQFKLNLTNDIEIIRHQCFKQKDENTKLEEEKNIITAQKQQLILQIQILNDKVNDLQQQVEVKMKENLKNLQQLEIYEQLTVQLTEKQTKQMDEIENYKINEISLNSELEKQAQNSNFQLEKINQLQKEFEKQKLDFGKQLNQKQLIEAEQVQRIEELTSELSKREQFIEHKLKSLHENQVQTDQLQQSIQSYQVKLQSLTIENETNYHEKSHYLEELNKIQLQCQNLKNQNEFIVNENLKFITDKVNEIQSLQNEMISLKQQNFELIKQNQEQFQRFTLETQQQQAFFQNQIDILEKKILLTEEKNKDLLQEIQIKKAQMTENKLEIEKQENEHLDLKKQITLLESIIQQRIDKENSFFNQIEDYKNLFLLVNDELQLKDEEINLLQKQLISKNFQNDSQVYFQNEREKQLLELKNNQDEQQINKDIAQENKEGYKGEEAVQINAINKKIKESIEDDDKMNKQLNQIEKDKDKEYFLSNLKLEFKKQSYLQLIQEKNEQIAKLKNQIIDLQMDELTSKNYQDKLKKNEERLKKQFSILIPYFSFKNYQDYLELENQEKQELRLQIQEMKREELKIIFNRENEKEMVEIHQKNYDNSLNLKMNIIFDLEVLVKKLSLKMNQN